MVTGFEHIYQSHVVHRDLKLANLFVDFPMKAFNTDPKTHPKDNPVGYQSYIRNCNLLKEQICIKIGDLGFSKKVRQGDLTQTQCGTPLVMAPEVIQGRYYNHKADVWSLGVIFFEMLTGFTPFTGRDKNDLTRNIEKGSYSIPKKLKLSLAGLDFLNQCLQYDIENRISWEDLLKHPYISEEDINLASV